MRGRREFRLFEIGKFYRRGADGSLIERAHLAGIAVGIDLLAIRDNLLEIARVFGADPGLTRGVDPHLHPGRTVKLGEWGLVGELHPRLLSAPVESLRATPARRARCSSVMPR